MSKRSYIVTTIEEKGKHYAYAIPITEDTNVLGLLRKDMLHVNIVQTRKRAKEIVEHWNKAYMDNGTYMFGNTLLKEWKWVS